MQSKGLAVPQFIFLNYSPLMPAGKIYVGVLQSVEDLSANMPVMW